MRRLVPAAFSLLLPALLPVGTLLSQTAPHVFSHADTLRGSNTPQRAWWDAAFYDLHVRVNPADSSISGWNAISYRVLSSNATAGRELQIDLQMPLVVDSMRQEGKPVRYRRDGNAFFAQLPVSPPAGSLRTLSVYYHGKPTTAVRPPWDGGFIWKRDSLGNRLVATANEGLGASVWWPNKDLPADEPDSQRVSITVPDSLTNVSNGRLRSVTHHPDGFTTWEWFVSSPINTYGIAVNAGRYAHYSEVYQGEAGPLTLDFWPLAYHEAAARQQFAQAAPMLACFEHWFGPYPWYEDGFKLVETPHLGMEHQSAVAYGNGYRNGYLGRDLSGTGHGLLWDFIIVHESAHEWWANSITDRDAADMWIHESFANYAEGLYTECQQGKQAGAEYVIGTRRLIRNDTPIVGTFGVNNEGSQDMYYKGGNMLHTIRTVINDDEQWRGILRGLQRTFRHQTVSGRQIREYITANAAVNLATVFAQYLETTKVPVLEYRVEGTTLSFRWNNVVADFSMPIRIRSGDSTVTLRPTVQWQTLSSTATSIAPLPDYYIETKLVTTP
jgi:aminopeptidase N